MEAAFGGPLVAPRLQENIEHGAVLFDVPPEIVPTPANAHERLVQVPGIAQAGIVKLSRWGSKPPQAVVSKSRLPAQIL
jgi:hypothetical protein